jgi:hypothetical protein
VPQTDALQDRFEARIVVLAESPGAHDEIEEIAVPLLDSSLQC